MGFPKICFRKNLLLVSTNNWKKIWAKSAHPFSIDEFLYIMNTVNARSADLTPDLLVRSVLTSSGGFNDRLVGKYPAP
jgi:hypothetical protein